MLNGKRKKTTHRSRNETRWLSNEEPEFMVKCRNGELIKVLTNETTECETEERIIVKSCWHGKRTNRLWYALHIFKLCGDYTQCLNLWTTVIMLSKGAANEAKLHCASESSFFTFFWVISYGIPYDVRTYFDIFDQLFNDLNSQKPPKGPSI